MKATEYILIAIYTLLIAAATYSCFWAYQFQKSCEARGGVTLRGAFSYQCIQGDALKPIPRSKA